MKAGWIESMHDKVDYVIEAIQENNEPFIHADCDIQFFGPTKTILLEAIEGCDIVAQSDSRKGHTLCAGFFVCRPSQKMLDIFGVVKQIIDDKTHDQQALNRCTSMFTWKLLDQSQFWSTRKFWRPHRKLEVPSNILMHHANWTLGLQYKTRMMQLVRDLTKQKNVV